MSKEYRKGRHLYRKGFMAMLFLIAFLPSVLASEKTVRIKNNNKKSECRRKVKKVTYPVIHLKKKDSNTQKATKKTDKRKFSFPV